MREEAKAEVTNYCLRMYPSLGLRITFAENMNLNSLEC